jgi:molecular chaperone GrpE
MQEDENNQNSTQAAEPEVVAEQTAEEKIAALEAALEEAKASVLYVKAEGENIRRRAMDDIDKARKFALEKFSNELLAVKDSLDAALAVGNADVESYKNGVEITSKQLLNVFEKFNIAEVNPIGEKFDPNKHQAISMLEGGRAEYGDASVTKRLYAE